MASKITLVESVVKVGFDGKAAERGLRKLKKQLQDSEKQQIVADRAKLRRQEMAYRKQQQQHKAQLRVQKEEAKLERDKARTRQAEKSFKSKERRADNRERRLQQSHEARLVKSLQSRAHAKQIQARADARERRLQEAHNRRMSRRSSGSRGGMYSPSIGSVATGIATGATATKVVTDTMGYEDSLYMFAQNFMSQGQSLETAKKSADRLAETLTDVAANNNLKALDLMSQYATLAPLQRVAPQLTDQHLVNLTEALAKSKSFYNLSAQDAANFDINFSQIVRDMMEGKVEWKDLAQIQNMSAGFAQTLMDALGFKSLGEFESAVEEEGFDVNALFNRLLDREKGLDARVGVMFKEKQENSLSGALQQLNAALNRISMVFGSGAMKGFQSMFVNLATVLMDNEAVFKKAGEYVGVVFQSIGDALAAFSSMPLESQQALLELFGTLALLLGAVKGISLLTDAFMALGMLVRMNPLAAIAAAIIGVKTLLDYFVKLGFLKDPRETDPQASKDFVDKALAEGGAGSDSVKLSQALLEKGVPQMLDANQVQVLRAKQEQQERIKASRETNISSSQVDNSSTTHTSIGTMNNFNVSEERASFLKSPDQTPRLLQ